MYSKQDHINHWKDSSEEDWKTAQVLFQGKRYSFCLFSLHLCIEKLLKAIWINESIDNTPPFIHDLFKIASDTGLQLSPDQEDLLAILNSWNLRGRYPDYSGSTKRPVMSTYVLSQMENVNELRLWLLKKI